MSPNALFRDHLVDGLTARLESMAAGLVRAVSRPAVFARPVAVGLDRRPWMSDRTTATTLEARLRIVGPGFAAVDVELSAGERDALIRRGALVREAVDNRDAVRSALYGGRRSHLYGCLTNVDRTSATAGAPPRLHRVPRTPECRQQAMAQELGCRHNRPL